MDLGDFRIVTNKFHELSFINQIFNYPILVGTDLMMVFGYFNFEISFILYVYLKGIVSWTFRMIFQPVKVIKEDGHFQKILYSIQ